MINYGVAVEQKLGLTACANEWHRLSMKLIENSAYIHLNDQTTRIPLQLTEGAFDEIRRQPVHLGSSTGKIALEKLIVFILEGLLTSLNTTSFGGCVRNFQLDGAVVVLNKAKTSKKVIIDGCPP